MSATFERVAKFEVVRPEDGRELKKNADTPMIRFKLNLRMLATSKFSSARTNVHNVESLLSSTHRRNQGSL